MPYDIYKQGGFYKIKNQVKGTIINVPSAKTRSDAERVARLREYYNVRAHKRNFAGKEIDVKQHYKKYKDSVNMSYSELKKWSQDPCSKKASLDRKPIKRNLRLLRKEMNEWNTKDIQDSKKTIAFNARMRKVKKGKPVCNGLSKRDISLKNWAYDPMKG